VSNEKPQQQLGQQAQTLSGLIALNPQLSLANGVYQNTGTQIRVSHLSSYIQGAVNDSYDHAADLSLFSIEIEKLLLTDELRAALSPSPVNFLLSFNFDSVERCLDLTQDFGGVSHFLASKVNSLDSVKIDLGRATLSTKRCAELNNINVVSEDISLLSFADQSYDLIIISQLEDLGLCKQGQAKLIKKLHLALKKTGRLVVNARNRGRLNKWTSAGSDVINYRQLYENEVVTDFSENELENALKTAGFLHWDSYASFSQSRSISNLLSKQYLSSNPHALNHFNRLGGIGNASINEYLLFKNLQQERGNVFDFASRFVIIASASATRSQQLFDSDFAHFSGTGRKPQWRATTQCAAASKQVTKTPVHPNFKASNNNSNIKLSQRIEPQEFQNGTLLLDQWLSALLTDTPASALKERVEEYSQWLTKFNQVGDFSSKAYDILPFNIIVDESEGGRNFNIIDPEWVVDTSFSTDFVLFRALFWFAFENKPLLKELAKQTGLSTIGLFVLHYMENLDSHHELAEFVEMEEQIQRQIGMSFRNKSIEYALLQTFDGEPVPQRLQPACQISWSDSAGIVDEHNSVFISWKASNKEQVLNHKAPIYIASKSILRIDPIASMGIFKFSSVKLLAKDKTIIWQLDSAAEIAKASQGLNISVSESDDQESFFTALNEDPHFLFDLEGISNLATTNSVEITFALLHNHYYNSSLATLSKAVSEQNVALFRQVGVLDTKQAEIEYLSSKLQNIDQHRQALQASMHEAQTAHQEHSENLTNALEAQYARVRQLEGNVIIRALFRARRVVSRMLGRP
jgi:SAM-dependent methyltransferase